MIRKEDFAVIKALNQRGIYLKDIAGQIAVTRIARGVWARLFH